MANQLANNALDGSTNRTSLVAQGSGLVGGSGSSAGTYQRPDRFMPRPEDNFNPDNIDPYTEELYPLIGTTLFGDNDRIETVDLTKESPYLLV